MKIHGVSFNIDSFSEMTEEEFLKEMKGEGYAHVYEDAKNRNEKLKEAYALMKKESRAQAKKQAENIEESPVVTPEGPQVGKEEMPAQPIPPPTGKPGGSRRQGIS